MCVKSFLDKIDSMELDNKIILFVFLIIGMFVGEAYIGALIIPGWIVFIEYPWVYQLVSYSVIGLICMDISLVVVITLKTAITNQILSENNKKLESKIVEMEKELKRLQGNR